MSVPAGWVRFLVDIDVPEPAGYDRPDHPAIQFYCHTPGMPRAGDDIEIDGPGDGLTLTISKVEHGYGPPEHSDHPHYELTAWAVLREPPLFTVEHAQQLLMHPDKLRKWIDRYPLLEPYDEIYRDITCEECVAAGRPGRGDELILDR